ncbi:YbfB/YjiJ family MFS transporter [Sneathiella sp. CAU 1612]|uniref:YbfB/YjiJ family MFS transporter n=1 Tax=Sneathiella sedimenti TaxID=2816034 RepID=A0ABS3F4K2_9PROT|nr:YbfB/YjiJ family MFS transporter [Sneathiella sedimenti]MBO0333440.1 YbfB/YjiJ family MFS transporter [Sneathiella sedimenti]
MTKSSGRMGRLAVGGLLALAVGLGISRFVYTPILPFMEIGLGVSKSDAGLIASANYLGYLLGALLGIRQSLPGSTRSLFLLSLIVCAVTTIAMGLTDSFELFLLIRLLSGAASAFVMVFGSALVLSRLAAEGRSRLSALYFAGVGVGISVSSLLIIALENMGIGSQGMWIASGFLSLLFTIPVFLFVPAAPEPSGGEAASLPLQYSQTLKALILSYFLFGFGYIITATFISTLVRQIPEVQWMQSIIWLVVGLGAIPSVALWSGIASRLGNSRTYAIANLILAIGVTGSVMGEHPLILILAAVLLGNTVIGLTALGLVEAREMAPHHGRQILAVMTLAFGIGQTIGPGFAGFLYDYFGNFIVASLLAAAGLVIACLLTWGLDGKKQGNLAPPSD